MPKRFIVFSEEQRQQQLRLHCILLAKGAQRKEQGKSLKEREEEIVRERGGEGQRKAAALIGFWGPLLLSCCSFSFSFSFGSLCTLSYSCIMPLFVAYLLSDGLLSTLLHLSPLSTSLSPSLCWVKLLPFVAHSANLAICQSASEHVCRLCR